MPAPAPSAARTALLAGATGLVGQHVLRRLLAHDAWARVVTLGRRPLGLTHPKLTHHVVDFDRLAAHTDVLQAEDIFCCLGTTMKQAGSKEAFRRVDFTYPLRLAELTRAEGARQYLVVSATGADPDSFFFYNQVKGELEAALQRLDFDALYLMRPSLLTGDRDETRLGERIAQTALNAVRPLLVGPLRRARPTAADDVAAAMLHLALRPPAGIEVAEPSRIRALAAEA